MTKQFEKLTDSQWEAISDIFIKRKRGLSLRSVVNALLYMVRVGCQWRNLPAEYPKWTAVNYYFEKWKATGVIEKINIRLNEIDRQKEQRAKSPSLLCVDSQSVKLNPMLNKDRGIDGNKKINGRKRQLFVDTGGRVWFVNVHAANIADGKGASPVIPTIKERIERLEKFLGDTAYNGIFAEIAKENEIQFEKTAKLDAPQTDPKFVIEPKRWVVERTIAWTNFFRRVVKDYERTVESTETWLLLANSLVMFQRIIT